MFRCLAVINMSNNRTIDAVVVTSQPNISTTVNGQGIISLWILCYCWSFYFLNVLGLLYYCCKRMRFLLVVLWNKLFYVVNRFSYTLFFYTWDNNLGTKLADFHCCCIILLKLLCNMWESLIFFVAVLFYSNCYVIFDTV
jgi:hypothetical protein